MSKIGLGIVTCNREDFFLKTLSSIDRTKVDEIVIVNDGKPYKDSSYNGIHVIQNEKNSGVGITKNKALKYLLDKECDYIFLQEDDIIIKNNDIFQKYIELYKASGIQHFNYGYHGPANKTPDKKPNPRAVISYKESNIKMALNKHCVGAFSFYTKEILNNVGLIDEAFLNAWEHVEHTHRIIKAGQHPPFWWFADLSNSYDYLDEIACSEVNSTIRNRQDWRSNINNGLNHYRKKHNITPMEIQDVTQNVLVDFIRNRKTNKPEKIDMMDVTFMIPVRIEDEYRLKNLTLIVKYLQNHFNTNILICEAGPVKVLNEQHIPNCLYMYLPDTRPEFHRTEFLNIMAKASKTPIIVNCDTDILLPVQSYVAAAETLRTNQADFCYPYDGSFYDVPRYLHDTLDMNLDVSKISLNQCNIFNKQSLGGIIYMNREAFFKVGMENENFISWGHEDWERFIRWQKLEMRVARVSDVLYHLNHSRHSNSSDQNPYMKHNEEEFIKVNNMTKEQLENYIKTFRWL